MHAGDNGSTDQSVEVDVQGTEEQAPQKPDSEKDQDSQAADSKRSGDAESAGGSCTSFECILHLRFWNNLPAIPAADSCDDLILVTSCMALVIWPAQYC